MKRIINADLMPAPRLELRWEKDGDTWENRICNYNLVIPLQENDCRRDHEDGEQTEQTINIGQTLVSMGLGFPLYGDEKGLHIDVPFRDGAHAIWDSKVLGGLPIYAVYEHKAQEQDVQE